MTSKLWRAIDRIGARKASRFEWEVVSGLPWSELCPFLTSSGGLALEVPDPDEPSEQLVVWRREDGTALLESPVIPARRPPIEVVRAAIVLHQLNFAAIANALAGRLGFIAHRPQGNPPLQTIGFVQDPGKRQVEVALFIPVSDPNANVLGLARLATQARIICVPTARWKKLAPIDAEVRDLESTLASDGEDRLTNVAAEMVESRKKARPSGAIIHVKPTDRWEDVKIAFSLGSGTMRAQIGERNGEISLLDRSGKPTKAATILGRVLTEEPPRWSNSFFPKKKGTDYRKAFQRFAVDLQAWIPVNDGHPFREDPSTHDHHARFQCEPLIQTTRSRDHQDE